MPTFAQGPDSGGDNRPLLTPLPTPQDFGTEPTLSELPVHPLFDQTVACLIYGEYSKETRESLKLVETIVHEWSGKPSGQDYGSLSAVSMTLFVTPEQHRELLELIKETPLMACTVQECAEAIERGISGEARRIDTSSRRRLDAIECAVNAGCALAELAADPSLPWEKQRALTFDVWNGMIRLQNFAANILESVQRSIITQLIEQAESEYSGASGLSIHDIAGQGIYVEAAQQTAEFGKTSKHIREVQEALVPLGQSLLSLPSPILKEVTYSQLESNHHLLGRALGLYKPNSPLLDVALDDWRAFLEYHIPLLSRYFGETAAEKALGKTKGEDISTTQADSAWDCTTRSQGDTVALSPRKWEETVFDELRGEHLWGLRMIGVPGTPGDRAFAIVAEVVMKANAEALACRSAYGHTLRERDPSRYGITGTDKEASRLVHGITDAILKNLPWGLPRRHGPLPCDPKVHLERTLAILEGALAHQETAPGLACAARMSSQELAIQLNDWDYRDEVLADKMLAARVKKLFKDVKVDLPDNWCIGLRERGILPSVQPKP